MTEITSDKIFQYAEQFDDWIIEKIKDPRAAEEYLNSAIKEYNYGTNKEAFMLALKHLVKAQGGFTRTSRRSGVNRQNLYRTMTTDGNPKLNTLSAILHSLGYTLAIEPIRKD